MLCLYSPCASYVVFFFFSPSRLIYRSRKMREMQGCSFHLRYLKATPLVNQHADKPWSAAHTQSWFQATRAESSEQTPTAQLCSHLSTVLIAAQEDLTLNNFHWLITGQNFALNWHFLGTMTALKQEDKISAESWQVKKWEGLGFFFSPAAELSRSYGNLVWLNKNAER